MMFLLLVGVRIAGLKDALAGGYIFYSSLIDLSYRQSYLLPLYPHQTKHKLDKSRPLRGRRSPCPRIRT